jgi:acetyltransferase
MDLNKLIKPKSLAVIGASEKEGFGGDTTRNLLKFSGNLDRVYLVNPKRDTIFGRKCYHSVAEIDDTVDLCIICTPKATVISLLREAAAKGCGGAVVFASGYSETGSKGKADEQELIEEANKLGIAVMGPNCAGFANFIDRIFCFAFLVEERDRTGNIGFISQSGQIILGGLDLPNMGFSYCISSGNSCNIKVEDYLQFLVDDPGTKVVAAYLEGITQPEKLTAAFRKAAMIKKPVIVLKTGKSQRSQQLAASHTGSLSGSDEVIRSVMRKYGVIEADDLEELCGTAAAFSWLKELPKGNRTVFMNVSGGEAGITAELADHFEIPLAEYKSETKEFLSTLVPEYGSVNNPFDMTAGIGYNTPVMVQAVKAISADPNVDMIVIGYTITPEVFDATITHMVDAVRIAGGEGGVKPLVWIPFIAHTRDRESADILKASGVPLLSTGYYAFRCLKAIQNLALFDFEDIPVSLPDKKIDADFTSLSEYDSLCFLQNNGIPTIPPLAIAATLDKAIEEAAKLGYPLVCKVHSADIQHKSDVGGVKLNIKSPKELEDAWHSIMASTAEKCPKAKVEGVLVRPMLKPGVEMIIGINNDKQFGPTVMIGMGGVFVELFKDVQLATAPLSKGQAAQMIKRLKAFPLLSGYRGSKPCNIEALTSLLVKISEIAAANKNTIKELDINPVFVNEEGVAIADALIIKAKER